MRACARAREPSDLIALKPENNSSGKENVVQEREIFIVILFHALSSLAINSS